MEATAERLGSWVASLDALTANVERECCKLRRDGVVGMSRANLRQIVSTAGVHVPPASFDRLLDQALNRANVPTGFFY